MSQPTLAQLPTGSSGVLAAPTALSPTVLRLVEMGLTEGAHVTLTRRAPFGDPIEVEVRGTRLCLRQQEAGLFPVRESPAASSPAASSPASSSGGAA